MLNYYSNFKHEQQHEHAVKRFFNSVSVPTAYLDYDNLKEYSDAKQLLKTHILNAHDRKVLDLFTRHWVIKHGNIEQARLTDIRNRLTYYSHKENRMVHNAHQKELRLSRQRKKLLDKAAQK